MPDSVFYQAALEYISRGIPVFPCRPGTKQPFAESNGSKDGTTDPAQIQAWWTKHPDANVAIPTGSTSKIAVVDLDGPEGLASFAALCVQHGGEPATQTSKTGTGKHLIFRIPEGVNFANSQSKLGHKIDTRGEGGYIVAPPSIHPSGAMYEWVDDEMPVADLPEWLNPNNIKPPVKQRMAMPEYVGDASDAERRASAYLSQMPPAVEGSGGHGALYAAASAMVHGFQLDKQTAYRLLAYEYNPRCVPPWDLNHPGQEREFRRKIEQAESQPHDQPRGYLLNDGTEHHDAMQAKAIAKQLLASVRAKPVTRPQVTLGNDYLSPPGFAGELCAWFNQTARMPQPELALANALTFVGVVVGRKVRTETDLRTNLYALGVADSGAGKDHTRKQIKRLCNEAGLTDKLLGGEEIGSDAAILAAASTKPSVLFQLDEIGHMLSSAKSRNATTFQRNIPVVLTKLFSSASTTFLGREYAGQERKDIDQPNVGVYGTTVPGRLYQGLTADDIRDGFLSRLLVFNSSNPDPDPQPVKNAPVPEHLINRLQAWSEFKPPPPPGVGDLAHLMRPEPMTIPFEPGAARSLDAFGEDARRHKVKVRGDRGLDALWARAYEHAAKIALVVACHRPCDHFRIESEHVDYAVGLTGSLIRSLVVSLQEHVSDSAFGVETLRVLRVIRGLGKATRYDVTRRTQGMNRKIREDALSELVESGEITVHTTESTSKGGRKGTVYVATGGE